MKTKWAWFTGWMFVMTFAALWLNQGCTGSIPPLSSIGPTATPTLPSTMIKDFESRDALTNPTLLGVLDPLWNAMTPTAPSENPGRGLGSWSANTYGGNPANTFQDTDGTGPIVGITPANCNTAINPCYISLIPGFMPNGSLYAAHVYGSLNTTAGSYEAHQFKGVFRNNGANPYYDASSFTGITFKYYFSSADTNSNPVFQVAIDMTLPASAGAGGICSSACYNHFQRTLISTPRDTWVTLTLPWNQIQFPGFGTNYGAHIGNPNFGSDPLRHLKKIIFMQWQSSNNTATGGVYTNTDYWVDDVQFY